MNVADRYEQWLHEHGGVLKEFADEESLSLAELRELIFVDQHIRNRRNLTQLKPDQYIALHPEFAKDDSLVIELYVDSYGYAEERGVPLREFLLTVPDSYRQVVASELESDDSVDSPAIRPSLDRYEIGAELGRGSFGVVYRARDRQLDRDVAIKCALSPRIDSTNLDEAKLVARIEHPAVVPVYDCGFDDQGRSFIVSKLIEGCWLSAWATRQPHPTRLEVCQVFIQLCDALAAAHRNGVVHRDLKPSNILITDTNSPMLLDFGLALRDWQPGRQDELVGTPAYMSPEQARGEGHLVDARSDVFSLGVLLYETLCGKRPWQSSSSRELLREIAHGSVRSIREFDSSVPVELERICHKATAASMAQRYGSAELLSEDLRWFCQSWKKNTNGADTNLARVPLRGLLPYTAEDAKTFWDLLPGQRDVSGRPDSVRWWLNKLESEDGTLSDNPPTLVLYGPSGSGKSSLLQAGVLPFIKRSQTRVIQIDCSLLPGVDEIRDHLASKSSLPSQSKAGTLADVIGSLREKSAHRILIVLDQFEQTLASEGSAAIEEVTHALRQADGVRLQVVLTVRDEFWSQISKLMRNLESPLREDRNAMGLERFARSHAEKVLRIWGPESQDDVFFRDAVELVCEDDTVIPVRLSLLATLLGGENWTQARLAELREGSSLGCSYLDSAFSKYARKSRQQLAPASRRVLDLLTPASGQIRGPARSLSEMKRVADLTDASQFEELLDQLDRQLHLVTPSESGGSEEETQYQLAHDFWTVEVREWLDRELRKTYRGRARSDLHARSSRWQQDTRRANLAGPLDCVRFALFGLGRQGAQRQSTMDAAREYLGASARYQLGRLLCISLLAFAIAFAGWYQLKKADSQALFKQIAASETVQLSETIEEAHRQLIWIRPLLIENNGREIASERVDLTLLASQPERAAGLLKRLDDLPDEMLPVMLERFEADLGSDELASVIDELRRAVSNQQVRPQLRLRHAVLLARLAPNHSVWNEKSQEIVSMLLMSDPTQLGFLVDGLRPVDGLLNTELMSAYSGSPDQQVRRLASFILAEYAEDEPRLLHKLLLDATRDQLAAIAPAVVRCGGTIEQRLLDDWQKAFDPTTQASNGSQSSPKNSRVLDDGRRRDPEVLLAQARVKRAREIGNIGAVLIQLGHADVVLPRLGSCHQSHRRSYLIENYAGQRR